MISATKPVIGITCGELHNKIEPWSPVVIGQSQTYIQSVIDAGGIPLLLPLTSDETVLNKIHAMLDGLFLAGGNDLHPSLYGQRPDSTTVDFSILRDTTEQYLLERALADDKPVLGVCRGMQLLNVHLGGTLYQDIAKDRPDALDHNRSTKLKTLIDLSHMLIIKQGTAFAAIVGEQELGANTHHHQAIDTLGKGIKAAAWTKDEIIEAIELPGRRFAIGVQSHPESLTTAEPRWQRLFNAFVQAAATRQ